MIIAIVSSGKWLTECSCVTNACTNHLKNCRRDNCDKTAFYPPYNLDTDIDEQTEIRF